jgi:hypothetical protein
MFSNAVKIQKVVAKVKQPTWKKVFIFVPRPAKSK